MLDCISKCVLIMVHLNSLFWKFHVVEDTEDDIEEVLPPVLLKIVAVTFHHFKQHRQSPNNSTIQHILTPIQEHKVSK